MSLYTFATDTFTTADDRKRRPVISFGQLGRTLALCVMGLALLLAMAHRGHAAESGFDGFVDGLWAQAHKRGVARDTFDRAFAGVTPDPAVLAKTHRQSEFTKTTSDYLASAVSASRIETGQGKAREWKATLEKADASFGVDPYIVLGVWGLETNFGKNPGDLSTIRCLATLAHARYRGDYFRKELLDALDILQQGHVSAAAMQGSWAGAMGQTQFMPSAFKRYAIDFDGHGARTSGATCRTRSARPPSFSRSMDGRPVRPGATRSSRPAPRQATARRCAPSSPGSTPASVAPTGAPCRVAGRRRC